LVFNGGWTHTSTGALPNGTTGWADTKLSPSTTLTQWNTHLSYYSRTSTRQSSSIDIGSADGAAVNLFCLTLPRTTGGGGSCQYSQTNASEIASFSGLTDASGFWLSSRTSNIGSTHKASRNGIILATASTSAGNLVSQTIKIACLEANYLSNKETCFNSIGDGLTDAEATNLYTAVQAFQTTLGRQVNVPLVSDTDAQAFLNAANITSFQQASAVNKLVVDLKAAGVWTKMKVIYPFVGGSTASHKFNLKDPRDSNDAYRLSFTGTWVHSSTGAKPDGYTGYADTYLIPSTGLKLNNTHTSIYSRTNTNSGFDFGVYDGVSTGSHFNGSIKDNSGNAQFRINRSGTYASSQFAMTTSSLFYLVNRTSSNLEKLYLNGSSNSSMEFAYQSNSLPSLSLYIGAMRYNYSSSSNSNREFSFISFGDGLTDAEATTFYTAVETYQTSLGRGVNTPIYNNGLVLNLDAGNANSYPGTGTTWFDLATSTNGTLVNSPTFNSNQFTFNGSQFVNFGNTNNAGTDSVTLVAWVKTIANQDYAGIIGKAFYGDKLGRFSLHTRTGGKLGIITQSLQNGALSNVEVTSSQNINTGNWVFVVGVIDRSYGNKLYINGVLDGVSTKDTSGVNWSTTDNFTIGFYNGNGSGYFNGSISNAFMYRRVLTDNEIINLYNSTRGRFGL